MFNITNYQVNVNQNNNEISPHTYYDGHYSKKEKQKISAGEGLKNWNTCTASGNVKWYCSNESFSKN